MLTFATRGQSVLADGSSYDEYTVFDAPNSRWIRFGGYKSAAQRSVHVSSEDAPFSVYGLGSTPAWTLLGSTAMATGEYGANGGIFKGRCFTALGNSGALSIAVQYSPVDDPGSSWTAVNTNVSPSRLAAPVCIHDFGAGPVVVVAGGWNGSANVADCWYTNDITSATWTQLTSTGFPARHAHRMCSWRGRLWSFGGYGNGSPAIDGKVHYSYDGATWTEDTAMRMPTYLAGGGLTMLDGCPVWIGGFTAAWNNPQAYVYLWTEPGTAPKVYQHFTTGWNAANSPEGFIGTIGTTGTKAHWGGGYVPSAGRGVNHSMHTERQFSPSRRGLLCRPVDDYRDIVTSYNHGRR